MKILTFAILMMISSISFAHGYVPQPYYHYHTRGGGMVTGWAPHVPMNMRTYENYYVPYGWRTQGYYMPPQNFYNFNYRNIGGSNAFGFSFGGWR